MPDCIPILIHMLDVKQHIVCCHAQQYTSPAKAVYVDKVLRRVVGLYLGSAFKRQLHTFDCQKQKNILATNIAFLKA